MSELTYSFPERNLLPHSPSSVDPSMMFPRWTRQCRNLEVVLEIPIMATLIRSQDYALPKDQHMKHAILHTLDEFTPGTLN